MAERLRAETTPEVANASWSTAYILMGLRYPEEMIRRLLEGVGGMRESVTYQAILREGMAEGRLEEARWLLQQLGRKRLGSPDPEMIGAIEAITDLGRIERMGDRLLEATSWDDLLATP